ncbi:MAG: hypothetical protein K2Q01_05360, partial [Rickettsiales bacterium]|nr:hypothetical protein [Rickettsiales bacterium]
PSASHYEQDIHRLLTVWSDAQPALLIASADPTATRKAVDSWSGWKELSQSTGQTAEELKKSVMVNDEYILAQSGEKALAQIKNSVTVGKSLKRAAPEKREPSVTVNQPQMTEMPDREFTLAT